MGETISKDLRLVLLAASAWLFEHDMQEHAEMMDEQIDPAELAKAIDALSIGRITPPS